MSQDLEQVVPEIEAYLKQQGLTVFYGTYSEGDSNPTEVEWSDEKSGWKGFIQTAKQAEARIIVIETHVLTEEDLVEAAENAESEEDSNESAEDKGSDLFSKTLMELKEHVGKVYRFRLYWFREGVKYSYSQVTDWGERVEEVCSEESDLEDHEDVSAALKDAIKEIETKAPEQLADELVTFIEKEYPHQKMSQDRIETFWKSKGLANYYPFLEIYDISVENKMNEVGSLAKLKFEQKESSFIPEVVEECLRWAKEKGKRISRAQLEYLLREKGLTLSKPIRETIYIKLKEQLENGMRDPDSQVTEGEKKARG
jgi:hypothetical protein